MSLADWTGLTASIGSWLHRADHTSIAPDLITLAEQDFNDELRARQMETQTSLTITSGYLAHPSDWLEWKGIEVTTAKGTHRISPDSEENVSDNQVGITSAEPYQYVVRGDRTYIRPAPDSSSYAYPTLYYAKVPALSASQTTNWLLTRYPGAYLLGSLAHAKAFLEDEVWEYFNNQAQKMRDRINYDSRRSSKGRQALTMKSDVKI